MKNREFVELLQALVRVPSFSREEKETASLLENWLSDKAIRDVHRTGNNVWVRNKNFDPAKPTILLCSHHDTVRPSENWTIDPFGAKIENGKIYGLGANDAGASVVSLVAAFMHFHERNDLKYNLLLALVAEEEISGQGGVRSILPEIGDIDFAIVGEPTGGQMATAEMGLMVLDCVAHGRSGHAARDEGDNAIYHAIKDIEWFRNFGGARMSVTMIAAGTQHNVVPAECRFTVDVRTNEKLTNEEVLAIVNQNVKSDVTPRSTHLEASAINLDHPIVKAAKALGINTFVSPTTSDQAVLRLPSVKIGPGQSARSHSADEFVELAEIEHGIELYIKLLDKIL